MSMPDAPPSLIVRLVALANSEPVRRFAATALPTAFALGLQFIAFVITARGLGVVALGQYAALLGLAAIGTELVSLGTADTLVRAVSRAPGKFPQYFGHMLMMIGGALLPVIALLTWIAVTQVKTNVAIPLVIASFLGEIITARLSFSVEMAMVAHHDTVAASGIRFGSNLARLTTAAIYFHFSTQLDGWILAVLAQGVIVAAVSIAIAWRRYGAPVWQLQKGEIRTGLVFGINQVAVSSQSNLDRVVLGRFADDATVGVYAAGARLLQVGLFPITIVTRILYPRFFMEGTKGIIATRRFALKNLPVMLATGIASGCAVAVVAFFLPAVLGADFLKSRDTAIKLAFALPIIGAQYLAADALTGAGFQSLRASIYVFTSLTFGFALVLGARLGQANGVIIAYLSVHALLAVILWSATFLLRAPPSAPEE